MKKLYIVETRNTVYWSHRKMDAIFHHVQYPWGTAKYKEVQRYENIFDKKMVQLNPPISEYPEIADESLRA